jgi:two-component system LytT family sensor kinase
MIKKIVPVLFNRVTLNVLFWLLFAFLHYYPKENVSGYLLMLAIVVLTYGPAVYFNNLVVIPALLLRRKYMLYALSFITLFALTTLETYYLHGFLIQKMPKLSSFKPMMMMGLPFEIFPNLLIFGMLAFGKFVRDGLKNERRLEEFKQDKLINELASLKAQINPHFLFNALNTIYGMASRTDKETADAVLKLSDILRHNLYTSDKNEISLRDEFNLIRQYISFTLLRLHDKDIIKLHITGDVTNQKIVPLILVPFIENAIKHGLDTHSRQKPVSVSISITGIDLIFNCANSKLKDRAARAENPDAIGLKNVKRRLAICYPNRHELEIMDDREKFTVNLKMKLL